MTRKKQLKSGRGQPDSLIIREAFKSEVSSHPSLSASREKTLNICAKGITRRCMRKSYRSLGISREGLKAGILLAHDTQRCDRPSQEMQDLPRACQDLSPPI